MVIASFSSESSGPASHIAPLKLESPVGQFLSQILVNHPHLLRAAVEQQLEQLQTDRDAEDKQQEYSATGMELVLYRLAILKIFLSMISSFFSINCKILGGLLR